MVFSKKCAPCNPEKLMLFLFPLITLGVFVVAVIVLALLPKLFPAL